MKISRIRARNFRCFEEIDISLGRISVLTGPNNSGKSSILRAVSFIQRGALPSCADVRSGMDKAVINFEVADLTFEYESDGLDTPQVLNLEISLSESPQANFTLVNDGAARLKQISDKEPFSRIIPFYSRRKVGGYIEEVRSHHAEGVFNISYLTSKLARIAVPTFPGHELYTEACMSILGFVLSAIPSENGLRAGRYLPNQAAITLDQMGDGVPSIAALLIELATAEGKLFLIEEPENDLHPAALKALLDLILASANRNQFIVSTHSNIVLQYLGAEPGSLFQVQQTREAYPRSQVSAIEDSPHARSSLLRTLGYSLTDFDLWDGWLIFEESSAERIFRDFLIPMFAPRLTSIRTLAANGTDDAEATFGALHRMVRFTHLEQVYRNTTWVRLDGDIAGASAIGRLRAAYRPRRENQFACFSQDNFELYYPIEFHAKALEILQFKDKAKKRSAKRELLTEVVDWLRMDRIRAKAALEVSARELIDFLLEIEKEMEKY